MSDQFIIWANQLKNLTANLNIPLLHLPHFMIVLAEFEFDAGKDTCILFKALLPELGEDYQRTKTALKFKDDMLILKVEANDIVSMRAALNGWLRLIKITYEMCSLTRSLTNTQVIN